MKYAINRVPEDGGAPNGLVLMIYLTILFIKIQD